MLSGVTERSRGDLSAALAARRVLTAPQQICVSIEELVLDGTLRPGDRLPRVDEMASSLCVCVPTANVALRSLRRAGVLSVMRGRNGGYRVTDEAPRIVGDERTGIGSHDGVSLGCYRQLLEVREVQDSFAARTAAESCTTEDVDELERLVPSPDALPEDLEEVFHLDQRFHRTLAQCTRNPLIIQLNGETFRALRRFARAPHDISPADVVTGLDDVVSAIRCRDGAGAADAMRFHLRRSIDFFDLPTRERLQPLDA